MTTSDLICCSHSTLMTSCQLFKVYGFPSLFLKDALRTKLNPLQGSSTDKICNPLAFEAHASDDEADNTLHADEVCITMGLRDEAEGSHKTK